MVSWMVSSSMSSSSPVVVFMKAGDASEAKTQSFR
jgi:hypothetical protein